MVMRLLEHAGNASDAVLTRLAPRSHAAGQTRVLADMAHRPWPAPDGPWLQGQTWLDLLFAHWSLPVDALRRAVPARLPLDTFAGRAWLGITPFEVSALRLHGTPPAPGLSCLPETNVRTYTTVGGKPGIYFLSLDADSPLAVAAARCAYRLPYFRAHMTIQRSEGEVRYYSRRATPRAALHVRYRPTGSVFQAPPGTLEHFLTERYCAYTLDARARVLRIDIHHPPWPLQAARAKIELNTMTAPYDIELPAEQPLLHFSARQDVVIWPPAPTEQPD
jgi:uncharacterized protein